jgi:hypothetical protein
MDALELLGQLGRVAPADQAVVDDALRQLAEASSTEGRRRPAKRSLIIATATAAALSFAAAGFLVAAGLQPPAPAPAPVSRAVSSPSTRPGIPRPSVAAVLTAFKASSDDILMVTKVFSGGDGPLGKTIIWISPAVAAPHAIVRARILNLNLRGSRLFDSAFSYKSPPASPRANASGCDAIFTRPRPVRPPGPGTRGTFTGVYYDEHSWATMPVVVQASNAPAISLRGCLTGSPWAVSGSGRLAGVKVIEFAASGGYEHLWVNAATFLPVRLISTGGGPATITFTFKFLPPTPANQAKLTVRIPADFSKIKM